MANKRIIPDSQWADGYRIKNGENAENITLNRAVDGIRGDVKEIWSKLWGLQNKTPNLDEYNTIVMDRKLTDITGEDMTKQTYSARYMEQDFIFDGGTYTG